MKTSINLALGTKNVKKKSYAKYVYFVFAGIVAGAMVIMAFNVGLKLQYSNLEQQERDLTTAINAQAEKKVQLLIVSERTKNITSLYSKRGELENRLEELVGIFPSSIQLEGLTAKNDEFVLDLSAPDLAAMNTVLENDLPQYLKESKSGIEMVNINSFQAQAGKYILSLRFQYPGGIIDE